MKETVEKFKNYIAKLNAYEHAMGIMYYDAETVMPKAASEHLGQTLGKLSEEHYKLVVAPELREILEKINSHKDEVDYVTRREAEEMLEDLLLTEKIPMDEYVAFQVELNAAQNAWHDAKVNDDYALFEPHLAKLIDYTIRFTKLQKPDMDVYDALLDRYEKGLTKAKLDEFFAGVRAKLVPIIKGIKENGKKIDDSFLNVNYPIEKQKLFSEYLMEVMHLDRDRCIIGETEHPFTTSFTKNDVRITTHYHEDMMASNMYSVIHEGGHALYELHIGDDLLISPLGGGASMGIHESQSRFYENIIGRSEEFVSFVFPKLQELFPEQLKGVTAHDMYLAVNKSEPSLIRTEADELTYSLHIMVRYELEKKLLSGELTTKDLPGEWNRLYKEYLGIDVPTNREGVLQDSHWSGGSFGYFPSYAIGSAYGTQMLAKMQESLDVFALVKEGNLEPIIAWLEERIYKYGALKKPDELIKISCEAEFDPNYYTDYLEKKFRAIYGI